MTSKERVVLITGGSRGIGAAMVTHFQKKGWKVATCATSQKKLEESSADFKQVCDVSKAPQVAAFVKATFDHFSRLDAVVNNAGLAGGNSLSLEAPPEESDELWRRIMAVNLDGTYFVCKHALPYLPDGQGRIINIASVLAHKGVPDQTAYCAAKHGVLGFTRALSHLVAARKITANVICPGWTRTDMAEGRMAELHITEKDFAHSVPLGRFIEPDEVAGLAYFLAASESAGGITGQSFTIDGGVLA